MNTNSDIFTPAEITRKLANIADITSNGFYFVQLRIVAEQWEKEANGGDDAAKQLIKVITDFEKMCAYIKSRS
jgi:hypothetical protein